MLASGCSNGVTGSLYHPDFFLIYSGSCSDKPADSTGDTCAYTTWQIDAKADTIAGSCYAYKNDKTWLKFEWSLTRIGPAPGS